MKITAMLRIKNEARWLAEVLESIHPLTREIVILDDGSTDASSEIALSMGADVIVSPFSGLDESRDKNYLLAATRERNPDYVLAIDGDEILEPGAAEKIREKLRPEIISYSMGIRYLWNDRQHYRGDGVYGRFHRASLFSLVGQGADIKFAPSHYGGNFHCGNVPHGLKGDGGAIPVYLLHLGYMYAEDRIRKYEWYNRMDPRNGYEDQYRHIVLGDVFPADSKFLHGGPLKIFSLPPGCWPIAQDGKVR